MAFTHANDDHHGNGTLPSILRAGFRGVRDFPRAVTRRVRSGKRAKRDTQTSVTSQLQPGSRAPTQLCELSSPSPPAAVSRFPTYETVDNSQTSHVQHTRASPVHTVKRKPVARPQPNPVQAPAHADLPLQPDVAYPPVQAPVDADSPVQPDINASCSTVWGRTSLYYKKVATKIFRRSDESSWSPSQGRPQGFNDVSDYQADLAKKSRRYSPRGHTPSPTLPDPKMLLSRRRYSAATTLTYISVMRTSVRTSIEPVELPTEPFPELEMESQLPVFEQPVPNVQADPSCTFDAIISTHQTFTQPSTQIHTPPFPVENRSPGSAPVLPKSENTGPGSGHQTAKTSHLAAPSSREDRQPSPVPSLLRPNRPYFLGQPENPIYTAFDPEQDSHVASASKASNNVSSDRASSPVQRHMAQEMHFEHHQLRQHSLSFLHPVAELDTQPPSPPMDYLGTANILGNSTDLGAELKAATERVLGRSPTQKCFPNTTQPKVKRKPVPATYVSPTTPPQEPFAADKFPLLDTAARSLDNGLLGLSRPLPPGHTSQNGSAPMIARPRPLVYTDGWVRRETDPARELFEQNKQRRLHKRRRDVAEWTLAAESEAGSSGGATGQERVKTTVTTMDFLSLIDFDDGPSGSPPRHAIINLMDDF